MIWIGVPVQDDFDQGGLWHHVFPFSPPSFDGVVSIGKNSATPRHGKLVWTLTPARPRRERLAH